MEVRRRFARWKVGLPAQIKLAGAERFITCHVDDISMMGVKFSLPLKLSEDKFIKLTLALSDSFVLNIEAWVGWHKHSEGVNTYGLFFTRIADSDKEKIYRYITEHHREELEKAWWQDFDGQKKPEEPAQDKRIFQRFSANLPVRLLNISSGREGAAITADVSAKGIGILSREELKAHTPIELWLQIPDDLEPVYTRGEVVWSKPSGDDGYRVGVSLEKADLMGLSRILRS